MRSSLLSLLLLLASSPARAEPEVTWQGLVFRLGYAHLPGPAPASGPKLGVAYRVELSRLAFEVGSEGESLEPSEAQYGNWDHANKAIVRAEYVAPFGDLAVRVGAGLGYGTEKAYAYTADYGYTFPSSFRQDGAHAELRAGIALGHGPIASIDVGLRLPLQPIDAPDPTFAPTIDLSLGIALGSVPGGRASPAAYETEVVLADVVSAVAMWAGALRWLYIEVDDCGECYDRPDQSLPAAAGIGGFVGYALAAPAIHAAHGNTTGAVQSVGYRVAATILGGVIGGVTGAGFGEGAVVGTFLGALAAPVVDYVIARMFP